MAINVEMPFHKARELMAAYRDRMPMNQPRVQEDNEPAEAPNLLVEAFSTGGPASGKPLVRHVLVKDLNKIMTRMKLEHPKGGIFIHKAPMGLYAMFDGQSTASEEAGPQAAEFCAKNFHTMLMRRLSQLPEEPANEAAVLTALVGSFADLDSELLANQPDIQDGCGAVVVLMIAEFAIVASLGKCRAFVAQVDPSKPATAAATAVQLCRGPILRGDLDKDAKRINAAGGAIIGQGTAARIRHPKSGLLSPVSRSLGDRAWKENGLIICQPDVQAIQVRGHAEHPSLLMTASTVAEAMSPQEMVAAALEFPRQPRAASGAIATKAQEAKGAGTSQYTVVELCFLPDRPTDEERKRQIASGVGPEPPPQPAKKAKVTPGAKGATKSVRLRHILLRYNDGAQQPQGAKQAKASRTRLEAETLLRRAIGDLRTDLRACKKTPKDSMEMVSVMTKKFAELCREMSECETAKKGGIMCGELGWMSPQELAAMGGSFKECIEPLTQGQLSDIAVSDQGLHLVQRVA